MKQLMKILMTAACALVIFLGVSSRANAAEVNAPENWFDAEYYAATNPDVYAVYGTEENQQLFGGLDNAMWIHYVTYGKAEGRAAAASDYWFDATYYANNNPDVVAVYGYGSDALLAHYRTYGREEGRLPSAGYEHRLTRKTTENTAVSQYKIVVNRSENTLKVYEADENGNYSSLVKDTLCSTGKNGHKTPLGEYTIYEHTAGGGFVYMVDGTYGRYGMRFKQGGYMFHSVCYSSPSDAAPIQEEVDALGSAASQGCIRLSVADAEWLYNTMPNGTLVIVTE